MISDVDTKLQKGAATSNRGLFDEDAHNAKRQVLLQRAAEAKRRIEAQNAVQSLQKKPNFELIEDCKLLNTTRCLNCYQFGSSLLIYFIIYTSCDYFSLKCLPKSRELFQEKVLG